MDTCLQQLYGKIFKKGDNKMNDNYMNSTKTFFLGALVGGLAGLLFAPKSGERLRKDICTACKQLAEDAKEMVQETEEDLKAAAQKGKDTVKNFAEETKDRVKEGVAAFKK